MISNQIIDIIKNSKKIAIMTHITPDGDAFGSALMMFEIIDKNFPNVEKHIYADCETISAEFLSMLNGVEINSKTNGYDTVICVDCSNVERFQKYIDIFNNAKHTICIDHHQDNTKYAEINYIEKSSSTCESIFTIFENSPIILSSRFYKVGYAGMLTDTNSLTTPSVTSNTYRILSKIADKGIDMLAIHNTFFAGNMLNQYRLLGLIYQKAKIYFDGKVIIIALTKRDFKKCNISPDNTQGMINQAFALKGALACAMISPKGRDNHISLRSKPGINVSQIATKLGGGGHLCASASNSKLKVKSIIKFLLTEFKIELANYSDLSTNIFE